MSTNQATQIEEPVSAVDTLLAKVRGPAILEKLARDWNIHARTPAMRQQFLELADEMHNAQLNDNVKAASDRDPFLDRALNGVRQANGRSPIVADDLLKEAAVNLFSSDQDVVNASIEYADYLQKLEQQAAATA